MRKRTLAAVAALAVGSAAAAADRQDPHPLARDIFKQLIEIKTTESGTGYSTPAAEAMAQRLREGGFDDVQVVGPGGRKQNMVARLKGNGRKRPVLLIGTSTSSRRGARNGRSIRSCSWRRTATSTAAARRT